MSVCVCVCVCHTLKRCRYDDSPMTSTTIAVHVPSTRFDTSLCPSEATRGLMYATSRSMLPPVALLIAYTRVYCRLALASAQLPEAVAVESCVCALQCSPPSLVRLAWSKLGKFCSLQILVTCQRPKHYSTTQCRLWREYFRTPAASMRRVACYFGTT